VTRTMNDHPDALLPRGMLGDFLSVDLWLVVAHGVVGAEVLNENVWWFWTCDIDTSMKTATD
jgi:hypothetical protein